MEQVQIAICGSGIAGLCLAHALLRRQPQWHIRIFEASETLREEGAAVGLGSNALEALALISPEIRQALDDAGGVRMDPTLRVMIGTGENAGQLIGDFAPVVNQVVVSRGSFWRALHKLLPTGVVVAGKELVDAQPSREGSRVDLRFADGSAYEVDALLGCDGVNSITREAVLGADHESLHPVYSNAYGHNIVLPIEKARKIFGEEYCSAQTQYAWVGDGGMMITDHADEGRSMEVIACWVNREKWTHASPYVEWPKTKLEHDLAAWGEFGKAVAQAFLEQPTLHAVGLRVHPYTPSISKGSICLVGDAAQAFLPFQGAGAGQAIEDALMLSTVLGACATPDLIPQALSVYDAFRRPRRAAIAKTSEWASLYCTGQASGINLDPERLKEELLKWNSGIYDYDISAAQAEALDRMQQDTS